MQDIANLENIQVQHNGSLDQTSIKHSRTHSDRHAHRTVQYLYGSDEQPQQQRHPSELVDDGFHEPHVTR